MPCESLLVFTLCCHTSPTGTCGFFHELFFYLCNLQIMRSSKWNGHHYHHRHQNNKTASLSPSSSSHTASMLPTSHEYSKPGWTYGIQPYGVECSSISAGTTGSQLHTVTGAVPRAAGTVTKLPISIRHNDLDCTTESSSMTSTTFSDNVHRRVTGLPSITTSLL